MMYQLFIDRYEVAERYKGAKSASHNDDSLSDSGDVDGRGRDVRIPDYRKPG